MLTKKTKKKTNSKPKIKLKSILKRNSFPVFFFVFFLTKCKHGFFSVYYRVTQFKRKTWCTRVICDWLITMNYAPIIVETISPQMKLKQLFKKKKLNKWKHYQKCIKINLKCKLKYINLIICFFFVQKYQHWKIVFNSKNWFQLPNRINFIFRKIHPSYWLAICQMYRKAKKCKAVCKNFKKGIG